MKQCNSKNCPTGGFKSQEECDLWCDKENMSLYEKECSSEHLNMTDYDNRKYYPCDYGDCPYDATYSEHCRIYCGLGVDE